MKCFVDTNVVIYWVDDGARADTVEDLLAGNAVISVQVLEVDPGVRTDLMAV